MTQDSNSAKNPHFHKCIPLTSVRHRSGWCAQHASQAQTCFKVAQNLPHFLPPRSSTPWSFPHCVGLLFMQYLKLFWKVHRKTFKCFQAFLPASACWEVMDENVKQEPQRESGSNCSFRMQMFTRRCRVLAGVARQDTVEGSTQG